MESLKKLKSLSIRMGLLSLFIGMVIMSVGGTWSFLVFHLGGLAVGFSLGVSLFGILIGREIGKNI